ncbi:hypothetical protein B5X24_HaOG215712 [Helicoverpa armigera]|nr:hypothetical protein B5X24_HaOG215712 [Helicoverpa armigera]
MVNQALKMFNDPDKSVPEPTYDPVTNTKYIYKVVSPKDLTVVAKKKIILKDKKNHTKIPKKIEEKIVKPVIHKEVPPKKEIIEEEVEPPAEAKVTRSGRKVKLPKQILPEGSPQKTKKKSGTIVSCFQCSALEQLIVKLKSLLPCLLKKVDGTDGKPCTINEDIGRLFGMNPGKYNIDVEALNCVKDKDGFCIHNPPKINAFNKDQSKPIQYLLKHADSQIIDNETENCARINSVAKWPTVSKRIWKLKQKTHEQSAKKMRLKSEGDTLIELGTEDFIFPKETENNVIQVPSVVSVIPENNANTANMIVENDVAKLLEDTQDGDINCQPVTEPQTDNIIIGELNKPKTNYVQFHSAHFDIRSSPIKPTSTVFRKFQINPSKMANYDSQVIRSLEMVNKGNKSVTLASPDRDLNVSMQNSESNLHLQETDNQTVIPNSNNDLHVTMASSLLDTLTHTDSGQHVTIPCSTNGLLLHKSLTKSNNRLVVSMPNPDTRLHVNMLNSNNDLHGTKANSINDLHDDMANNRLHVTTSNSSNGLHMSLPDVHTSLHVSMPNSENGLHVPMPSSNGLHLTLPSSDENLRLTIPTSNDSCDVNISNTDSLHDLFKDDVDLSCKDTDVIDPVLKDWIISTSEKSEDGFSKSSGLIEPALLHVRDSEDKSLDSHKNANPCDDMPSLDSSDNRLLSSQGESVLNFLDTLGNDLYPETEIRNNGVDFQLDLFTFNHS